MAWDLSSATSAFLVSTLRSELDAELNGGESHTRKISVPFSFISMACEQDIKKESQLSDLITAIIVSTGWIYKIYFMLGVVEIKNGA